MAKTDAKPAEVSETVTAVTMPAKPHWQQPAVILIMALVLLVVFALGATVGRMHVQRHANLGAMGRTMQLHSGEMKRHFAERGMAMQGDIASRPMAKSDILQGVVTAFDGSTLTVAGHGSVSTVQVTADTQYLGASKVAVNDSVQVFGDTAGGVLTAERIIVNR